MNSNRKTLIVSGILLILFLIGLPVMIFLSQKKQETRSRASASTTLYFEPSTSPSSPIVKNVNDLVSLNIMVTPGTNRPSIIKLEIQYDATKLTPTASPFVVNTVAFPETREGPFVQNGKILISVSVGADPTKAISQLTQVGTVNFKAISPTTSPAVVSFGSTTQVLSVGSGDQANENVLSTTSPAYISVASVPTPTPTPLPPTPTAPPGCYYEYFRCIAQEPLCQPQLVCPTPTPTPTPIILPTSTTAPTPTPVPKAANLTFSVLMHGIGSGGDNANPTGNSLSNKNPLRPTRDLKVEVLDYLDNLVGVSTSNIVYSSADGDFKGTIVMNNFPGTGAYTIKITSSKHLRRLIPGIQNIIPGQNNNIQQISLIAGDTNTDNILNILDYNLLVDCYSDIAPALACNADGKLSADLNDDGNVNQTDYNLFLRELSVQNGQ